MAAQADMRKTLEEYKKRETAATNLLESREARLTELQVRGRVKCSMENLDNAY